MFRNDRFEIRSINYAMAEQLIILIFTSREVLNLNLLNQVYNILNQFSLENIELILTRSFFDLNPGENRIYMLNELTFFEAPILQLLNITSITVRRTDFADRVEIEYEWM